MSAVELHCAAFAIPHSSANPYKLNVVVDTERSDINHLLRPNLPLGPFQRSGENSPNKTADTGDIKIHDSPRNDPFGLTLACTDSQTDRKSDQLFACEKCCAGVHSHSSKPHMFSTLGTGIYPLPDAARILGLSLPKLRRWLNDSEDGMVRDAPEGAKRGGSKKGSNAKY
ncbi:hypothetical protein J3R74_003954 [Puniceicoccus vermicola]|uniref:Uncharacterized protein n=1 Tax=Puniceicoccus vermicola TaxID=388746 RepID=A0A7X1B258_9BACT|nr:hypothetical protein [Puniceicoccus vermicola]MBC2604246.1 hypothetical protein [Puniceicoccus vermicola]